MQPAPGRAVAGVVSTAAGRPRSDRACVVDGRSCRPVRALVNWNGVGCSRGVAVRPDRRVETPSKPVLVSVQPWTWYEQRLRAGEAEVVVAVGRFLARLRFPRCCPPGRRSGCRGRRARTGVAGTVRRRCRTGSARSRRRRRRCRCAPPRSPGSARRRCCTSGGRRRGSPSQLVPVGSYLIWREPVGRAGRHRTGLVGGQVVDLCLHAVARCRGCVSCSRSPEFMNRSCFGSGVKVARVESSGFAGACATPFFVTNANWKVSMPTLAAQVAFCRVPATGSSSRLKTFSAAHHLVGSAGARRRRRPPRSATAPSRAGRTAAP